jgi:hypothetical protein
LPTSADLLLDSSAALALVNPKSAQRPSVLERVQNHRMVANYLLLSCDRRAAGTYLALGVRSEFCDLTCQLAGFASPPRVELKVSDGLITASALAGSGL